MSKARQDLKNLIGLIIIGLLLYVAVSNIIAPKVMPKTQCPEGFVNNPDNPKECIPKSMDTESIEPMKQAITFVMIFLGLWIIFGTPYERRKR